jgi:molybdopterin-binding protein
MSHSVSLEGNQNGTIRIDANTGWILGSNLKLNTTEKESLSDGKQSQTLSKTSNSLVSINPSYKF